MVYCSKLKKLILVNLLIFIMIIPFTISLQLESNSTVKGNTEDYTIFYAHKNIVHSFFAFLIYAIIIVLSIIWKNPYIFVFGNLFGILIGLYFIQYNIYLGALFTIGNAMLIFYYDLVDK